MIPDYITSIPDNGFANHTEIVSLVIPRSVSTIGSFAFFGCENLESITIPESVKDMGSYAFANCHNLKEVNIVGSISSLKDHVFDSCSSLQNFVAPSSLTYIGWGAFRNCTSLTNISLPKETSVIENSSFEGCFGLRNIYLYRYSSAVQYFDEEQYNIIYVDTNESEPTYKLEGYSLSLNNAMGLKFYFTFGLDLLEDKDAYVSLHNGHTEQVIKIASIQPEYNGYYGFCANVNVKELFEPITCTIYDGQRQVIASYTYSTTDYLDYILEHEEEYPAYISIVKAIRNYGICTMNYFGTSQTTFSANSNREIDLSSYRAKLNDNVPFRGARLVLKTQLGMKLYFTDGNEFYVDGQKVEPKLEDGYKLIEIDHIKVENIDQFHTITVDGQSMEYSLLSYGYVGLQTGNEQLIQLIQSLYTYFETVGSYKEEVERTLTNVKEQFEQANTKYSQAEKAVSSGVLSYFESILNNPNATVVQKQDASDAIDTLTRHSTDRLTYIENPQKGDIRKYSTIIGGKEDATSWDRFLLITQEAINKTNAYRNEEKLPSLMTSCYMMAAAQVQSNASAYVIGHSRLENVGENLYWTYVSPDDANSKESVVDHLYEGWYVNEKLVNDYLKTHPNATNADIVRDCNLPDESYIKTGHYENIVDDAVATGFGTTGNATLKGCGYKYVYSQTFSSNKTYALYDVNDFMNGAKAYYNSIVDTYIQSIQECTRLSQVIETLEASLQTNGMR